jgi:hypothetical protein
VVSDRSHKRRREPVVVRVVDYALEDPGRAGHPQHYRLVTSILDPGQAPAAELAALYQQRWELEGTLDELKTHQRGPRAVLRSKTPEGVEQEVYAHLLVHYAIRALMHQVALDARLDPDRLSFTGSLRIVRRQLIAQAAFPPDQLARAARLAIGEILAQGLPARRLRAFPAWSSAT